MFVSLHEIPSKEWGKFFDRFSKEHQGARVDIETRVDAGTDYQAQANDLPLEGISADFEGTRSPALEVSVGVKTDQSLTHIIHNPTRVRVGNDEGVASVEIDSPEDGSTLIHFKSGPNPDITLK